MSKFTKTMSILFVVMLIIATATAIIINISQTEQNSEPEESLSKLERHEYFQKYMWQLQNLTDFDDKSELADDDLILFGIIHAEYQELAADEMERHPFAFTKTNADEIEALVNRCFGVDVMPQSTLFAEYDPATNYYYWAAFGLDADILIFNKIEQNGNIVTAYFNAYSPDKVENVDIKNLLLGKDNTGKSLKPNNVKKVTFIEYEESGGYLRYLSSQTLPSL